VFSTSGRQVAQLSSVPSLLASSLTRVGDHGTFRCDPSCAEVRIATTPELLQLNGFGIPVQ